MAGSQRIQPISNQPRKRIRRLQNLPHPATAELKVKGGSPQLMLACAGQHIKEATVVSTGK
jgi:hypothetical protein